MSKAPVGRAAAPRPAPTGRSVAPQSADTGKSLTIADDRNAALYQHAGSGQERVGLQDILLPRLKVLQSLSPEVNRRNADYVAGAEPGMILNVATRKLYTAVQVVPCAYIRHHIEWLPARGGFVRDHGDNEAIMSKVVKRDDNNYDILPGGNLIVPTPTWYVILIAAQLPGENGEGGEWISLGGDPGIISMPRTQSKPSRQWMSQATSEKLTHPEHGQFPAPLFYRSWVLSTAETENEKGTWSLWTAAPDASITDTVDGKPDSDMALPADTMPRAIRFRDQVMGGEVRAQAEHFADDDQRGTGGGGQQDESAPM